MRKVLILSVVISVLLSACGNADESSIEISKQESTTTVESTLSETDKSLSQSSTISLHDDSGHETSSTETTLESNKSMTTTDSEPSKSITETTTENKGTTQTNSSTSTTSSSSNSTTTATTTTKKAVTSAATTSKKTIETTTTTSKSTTRLTTAEPEDTSANPFNKQDNKEVRYDSSRWVQPRQWNSPTINPKDYQGGIMLFFDKIGLDSAYCKGKVQRVYFSLVGATEPVSRIKFHIFYDTRLTLNKNSKGEVLTTGRILNDFTTGSSMVENGQLVFYAVSNKDIKLGDGCIFTIDFVVPDNAQVGDFYPIGISYVVDNVAADTFINSKQDDAGKLQMTYVFTKGIHNGYIKIYN